jgi:hypothetical protein
MLMEQAAAEDSTEEQGKENQPRAEQDVYLAQFLLCSRERYDGSTAERARGRQNSTAHGSLQTDNSALTAMSDCAIVSISSSDLDASPILVSTCSLRAHAFSL